MSMNGENSFLNSSRTEEWERGAELSQTPDKKKIINTPLCPLPNAEIQRFATFYTGKIKTILHVPTAVQWANMSFTSNQKDP